MAVPDTTTFKMTDVVTALGGGITMLSDCFTKAAETPEAFDSSYTGYTANSLLRFRHFRIAYGTLGFTSFTITQRRSGYFAMSVNLKAEPAYNSNFTVYCRITNAWNNGVTLSQSMSIDVNSGVVNNEFRASVSNHGTYGNVPDEAYDMTIQLVTQNQGGTEQVYPEELDIDYDSFTVHVPAV